MTKGTIKFNGYSLNKENNNDAALVYSMNREDFSSNKVFLIL